MITAQEAKEAAIKTLSSQEEAILDKLNNEIANASSCGRFSIDITGIVLTESIRSTLDEKGYRIVAKKSDSYIIKQQIFWD